MDNDKEVKVEEVSVDTEPVAQDAQENIDETEQLKQQVADVTDKYMRAVAELDNTRRRMTRDMESLARNRAMSVAKEFLPVMDAITAALNINPDDDGVKSMYSAMESAFARIGIVKIESVGQKLNPQFHNAIQLTESPDSEPNTIIQEMQAGYMFADSVLRPAMVIVSK